MQKSDVFSALTVEERQAWAAEYLEYLRARDGVPDRQRRRLERRESFFEQVDACPLCWEGCPPVSQEVFDRNLLRTDPESGIDEPTLWALAAGKINRAERFGVELGLTWGRTPEGPLLWIELEEVYHTRILRDALRAIGIELQMQPPRRRTRWIIHAMAYLPRAIANIPILAGEVWGAISFRLLLDKAHELFGAQPEVVRRIDSLFRQILVDEVGHVHYARSTLGPIGMAAAKRLLPLLAGQFLDDMPEMGLLFGRQAFLDQIMKADIDGAVALYPERFVFRGRQKPARESPTLSAPGLPEVASGELRQPSTQPENRIDTKTS
jgi:hypothetical protein